MQKFLSALIAAQAQAATVTLNPTADAYVQNGTNAGKNYGTNTQLRAQTNATASSNYDSYLKFDTTSAGGQVTSAKLRLYASLSGTGSVASSAYAVSNTSWGETTITWNNKPALGAVLGSASTTSTSYAWKEIDVTAYVQSEKAAGRNVITLGLHNGATSSVYVRANSRNATSNKPQLVITTNAAPTVGLSSPANGASLIAPASVTLSATASDSDGTIAKVEFYNGTTLIGAGTLAGSSYTLSWNSVAAGSYSLTAKATDNLGAVTTSAPVSITVNPPANVPPTVSLTGPANGSVYIAPASVALSATASDSDGTISKVEFYNGATLLGTATSAPYGYSWNGVPAGSYSLTAKAYDNAGAVTTSGSVSITVNANQAPTVSLAAPTAGSSFDAPASITLTANAADSDGSIAYVEFYSGAMLLSAVTTPPYSYTWSNVVAGSYTLHAKAYDNLGAATDSASIGITVNAVVAHGVYYIYADHLNTPRVITDNTNKVVWRWDSDPFGTDVANENPSGLGSFSYNLRFPGQYFDKETGLHYNYFRDYDPSTGRYVQSDPIGLKGGINPFAYVSASPLAFVDPFGLSKRKLDPNSQECKDLAQKIQNIKDDIAKRQTAISMNPQSLPLLPTKPGTKPRESVYGHQGIINDLKTVLAQRIEEYNQKCGCDSDDCSGNSGGGGNGSSASSSPSAGALFGLGACAVAACAAFPEVCIPGLVIGGLGTKAATQ